MPADKRRQAIVEAALRLFSQYGFRGATTRRIANEVGVSEPVLYMHFQTKQELYSAIIEHLAAGVHRGRCSGFETDREFFLHLAQDILAWHIEDPARIRVLLFSALEGHELADQFYERQILPFMAALSAYIRERVESGAFRQVDPLHAARAFCGMIGQFGQAHSVFGKETEESQRARFLSEVVDIFLNGVRKPGGE